MTKTVFFIFNRLCVYHKRIMRSDDWFHILRFILKIIYQINLNAVLSTSNTWTTHLELSRRFNPICLSKITKINALPANASNLPIDHPLAHFNLLSWIHKEILAPWAAQVDLETLLCICIQTSATNQRIVRPFDLWPYGVYLLVCSQVGVCLDDITLSYGSQIKYSTWRCDMVICEYSQCNPLWMIKPMISKWELTATTKLEL